MKKLLLVIFATVAAIHSNGQIQYINVCSDCDNLFKPFDFNSPMDSTHFFFRIDTSQATNLWQLGIPDKTEFNTGLWGPKALLTDTINPYPVNASSSFEFSILNCSPATQGNCGGYAGVWMYIASKTNSDLYLDGGTMEVSHNGGPWMNLIMDPLASVTGNIYLITDTVQSMQKPGYSGLDTNWKQINVHFLPADQAFDTITFRFTFTSDAIQTNKDGWMIGAVQISGLFMGINEMQNNNLISISPNPVSERLSIHAPGTTSHQTVQILSYTGQILYTNTNFIGEKIDTRQLMNGIYLLKYSDTKTVSVKRFVVQHE